MTESSRATETVKLGDRVSIQYVGKLEDGTVFDHNQGRDPLEFEAGSPNIIAGMSEAVVGMQVGEEKTVEIPPEQGYGPRNDELVIRVASSQLPDDAKEGDTLSDNQPNSMRWVVTEKTEEETVLDGNHPLAGKTIIFDVTLVGIL